MINERPEHPDLESYLDGQLEGAALKEFDAARANDPALLAVVAQAEQDDATISNALKRSFSVPDQNTLEQILRTATKSEGEPPVVIGRINWIRRWAVAAILVLGLGGTWMIFDYLNSPVANPGYDIGPHQTIPELFARADAGELNYWVCDDDKEFATAFYQKFSHAAKLNADLPENLTALGLCFVNSFSENAMILGGTVGPDQEPVILIIDQLENDSRSELDAITPASGFKIQRREAVPFVFYEISRLDETFFLDALNPIEMPTEWIPGWGRFGDDPPGDGSDQ